MHLTFSALLFSWKLPGLKREYFFFLFSSFFKQKYDINEKNNKKQKKKQKKQKQKKVSQKTRSCLLISLKPSRKFSFFVAKPCKTQVYDCACPFIRF